MKRAIFLFLIGFPATGMTQGWQQRLSDAALERTKQFVVYDGSYRQIDYPNGDVQPNRGVCTDVVIRSYRSLGFDLQQAVHEDMSEAFDVYPDLWGLTKPDSNIDHRRVPNLRAYFARHGQSISPSGNGEDYLPGDIVTWVLDHHAPHIGIVTHLKSDDGKRPLIVHNIGLGPKKEDMLFDYRITGHYRFDPEPDTNR